MDPLAIKSLIEEFLERLTVVYDEVLVVGVSEPAFGGRLGSVQQFLIKSQDSRLLIGNQGAGLDALNLVLRQLARRRFGGSEPVHFVVDVNQYRARRMEELIRSAETFADRARLFKRDIEMPPAPSFERMLIHAHFADDPDIATESSGEGRFRRVIIRSRIKESLV